MPLLTAVLTFFLTSVFTLYRERKASNLSKRALIQYEEWSLTYPFTDKTISYHGEGLVLLNRDARTIVEDIEANGPGPLTFLIIRNISENDVFNVSIRAVITTGKTTISQQYTVPVWNHATTLYIPYATRSLAVGNEELVIMWSTVNFERFKLSYTKKSGWTEVLQERFMGIWITKQVIPRGDYYSFTRVTRSEDDTQK